MPTGMSKCKYCGKPIPNFYKKHHETVLCLVMRKRRGDPDVIHRKLLPRIKPILPVGHPSQKRLLEFGVKVAALP